MLLAALTAVVAGCAHGGQQNEAPPPAPPPSKPVTELTLHWTNAADTTRTLRWPSNKPFRTDLTLTGMSDSLQGYTIQFRMEPTTTTKGSAWRFADSGNCLAAVWAGTAEKDPFARAQWQNELMNTDVRPLPDCTTVFVVASTFDLVAMHPESTYSLCHMDFTPPQAASDSVACAGWDAPVRLYVEQASLLFPQMEQPVFEMGKPIFF